MILEEEKSFKFILVYPFFFNPEDESFDFIL